MNEDQTINDAIPQTPGEVTLPEPRFQDLLHTAMAFYNRQVGRGQISPEEVIHIGMFLGSVSLLTLLAGDAATFCAEITFDPEIDSQTRTKADKILWDAKRILENRYRPGSVPVVTPDDVHNHIQRTLLEKLSDSDVNVVIDQIGKINPLSMPAILSLPSDDPTFLYHVQRLNMPMPMLYGTYITHEHVPVLIERYRTKRTKSHIQDLFSRGIRKIRLPVWNCFAYLELQEDEGGKLGPIGKLYDIGCAGREMPLAAMDDPTFEAWQPPTGYPEDYIQGVYHLPAPQG